MCNYYFPSPPEELVVLLSLTFSNDYKVYKVTICYNYHTSRLTEVVLFSSFTGLLSLLPIICAVFVLCKYSIFSFESLLFREREYD